ncbi:CopD family protein [Agrobacterium sp. DE0009]|uniref:CopD family protein n=1 Tax=Agrobacterium sp. DE0009 TaxID=2587505 RepID=UPI0011A6C0A9|nr:CopD family protein [Agrobacterium sp. DE0009]
MIALVKFLHFLAISIWVAGLVSLPSLYVQRAHVQTAEDRFRLQKIVRFSYIKVLSPAAFIAVASGTTLIFLQSTYLSWFSAKLVLVALLVLLHVLTGLVIIRLFNEGEVYPAWRFVVVTAVSSILAIGIVYLALAKPEIPALLPCWFHEPGALKRILDPLIPWETP